MLVRSRKGERRQDEAHTADPAISKKTCSSYNSGSFIYCNDKIGRLVLLIPFQYRIDPLFLDEHCLPNISDLFSAVLECSCLDLDRHRFVLAEGFGKPDVGGRSKLFEA